jgi:hypothetical protein
MASRKVEVAKAFNSSKPKIGGQCQSLEVIETTAWGYLTDSCQKRGKMNQIKYPQIAKLRKLYKVKIIKIMGGQGKGFTGRFLNLFKK